MKREIRSAALTVGVFLSACASSAPAPTTFAIVGEAEVFAPQVASTAFAEIRLTISPDGATALWFSRNRPGGAGGYDIWMSRRTERDWGEATPVSFNTAHREFDPAFTSDGRYVYFCSDRPGGLGGDDIYRVAVTASGFGAVEHLGAEANSAGNEWAPMLARGRLLFSSNGRGGAGKFDLFISEQRGEAFAEARGVPGDINTGADEFDATYLADGDSIVFSRARDMQADRIDLFFAASINGRYGAGEALPLGVNHAERDTYAPMLDWSEPDTLTFSGQRTSDRGMDLYLVRYRVQH
jgi:TolB protein